MRPESVVRELWNAISARDWPGLAQLLDPDVRVYWPATGETFVGPANFVAVQSEYPEGWEIDVLTVLASSSTVVTEVEVPHAGFGVFRAASFWTVRDGRVTAVTEYWVTVGGEVPPDWRRRYRTQGAPQTG